MMGTEIMGNVTIQTGLFCFVLRQWKLILIIYSLQSSDQFTIADCT